MNLFQYGAFEESGSALAAKVAAVSGVAMLIQVVRLTILVFIVDETEFAWNPPNLTSIPDEARRGFRASVIFATIFSIIASLAVVVSPCDCLAIWILVTICVPRF